MANRMNEVISMNNSLQLCPPYYFVDWSMCTVYAVICSIVTNSNSFESKGCTSTFECITLFQFVNIHSTYYKLSFGSTNQNRENHNLNSSKVNGQVIREELSRHNFHTYNENILFINGLMFNSKSNSLTIKRKNLFQAWICLIDSCSLDSFYFRFQQIVNKIRLENTHRIKSFKSDIK